MKIPRKKTMALLALGALALLICAGIWYFTAGQGAGPGVSASAAPAPSPDVPPSASPEASPEASPGAAASPGLSQAASATPEPTPAPLPEGRINADDVNLRAEPSMQAGVVAVLALRTPVTVLESRDEWYRISAGELEGYVKAEFVTLGELTQEAASRSEAISLGMAQGKADAGNAAALLRGGDFAAGNEALLAAAQSYGKAAEGYLSYYDGDSDAAFLLGLKARWVIDTYQTNIDMYQANEQLDYSNDDLLEELAGYADDMIYYAGRVSARYD